MAALMHFLILEGTVVHYGIAHLMVLYFSPLRPAVLRVRGG